MQHEIKKSIPLLDKNGNLTEAGYAKKLLPVYDRTKVKGGFARLKEWDYYYVGNDRFGVALTIADNSYMGLDSVSFLSFTGTPWEITKSPMSVFPMGKTNLPPTSASGVTAHGGKDYGLKFTVDGGKRRLQATMAWRSGSLVSFTTVSAMRNSPTGQALQTPTMLRHETFAQAVPKQVISYAATRCLTGFSAVPFSRCKSISTAFQATAPNAMNGRGGSAMRR